MFNLILINCFAVCFAWLFYYNFVFAWDLSSYQVRLDWSTYIWFLSVHYECQCTLLTFVIDYIIESIINVDQLHCLWDSLLTYPKLALLFWSQMYYIFWKLTIKQKHRDASAHMERAERVTCLKITHLRLKK